MFCFFNFSGFSSWDSLMRHMKTVHKKEKWIQRTSNRLTMIIFSKSNKVEIKVYQFVVEFETHTKKQQILYNYCYYDNCKMSFFSESVEGWEEKWAFSAAVPLNPRVFDSHSSQSSTVFGRGLPAVSGKSSVKKAEIKADVPNRSGGILKSTSANWLK